MSNTDTMPLMVCHDEHFTLDNYSTRVDNSHIKTELPDSSSGLKGIQHSRLLRSCTFAAMESQNRIERTPPT